MAQLKYTYTIKLQYLNAVKGTYKTFDFFNIKYIIIDRDYDILNMPIIYISLMLDKNDLDDMIKNVDTNLMNLIIYKHLSTNDYDDFDVDDEYFSGQCVYFINDQLNPNKEIDYPEETYGEDDVNTITSLGLIPLEPMNLNIRTFNVTLENSTMINAVKYALTGINNLVLEPLDYNPTLQQIPITAQDTVSKAIKALNNESIFYRTRYRFFMDFDSTYLISSGGYAVPKRNEKINVVLISVKSATDSIEVEAGYTINKKQGNYQILVPVSDANYFNNKASEKIQTKFVTMDMYGKTESIDVDVNSSSYNTEKIRVIGVNDDSGAIENLRTQTENEVLQVSIVTDCIDSNILSINNTIVIKNTEDNEIYDGQYLMSRKREIFVANGVDFYMSVLANFKMIRSK